MAKKSAEVTAEVPDLTIRISRFLTNVINTPGCHNFHAEAAALRELVGYFPPEAPATEPTRFSEPGGNG